MYMCWCITNVCVCVSVCVLEEATRSMYLVSQTPIVSLLVVCMESTLWNLVPVVSTCELP